MIAIKETAIDCSLHDKSNVSPEDAYECHSFGMNLDPKVYSFIPNIKNEEKSDTIIKLNTTIKEISWRKVPIDGTDYMMRMDKYGKPTFFIYTMESFLQAKRSENMKKELDYVGKVEKKDGVWVINTGAEEVF